MQSLTLKDQIVNDIIETCVVKGVVVKANTDKEDCSYHHMTISLFPTPFPSQYYFEARELQPHIGTMISDLVHKPQTMYSILSYFEQQDPFLQRLIGISRKFNSMTSLRQDIHSLILRSDYMIDTRSNKLKLVEFNTIAAGLSSLNQRVWEIQNYIIDKYGDRLPLNYQECRDDGLGSTAIDDIGDIFANGIKLYIQSMKEKVGGKYLGIKASDIWVLIIIDEVERNIGDQKCIESIVYDRHKIKSMRMTFKQVYENLVVEDATNALKVCGREIGFIYFRNGYQFEQYKSERDWQTREILECTMPIKCPSIDVHLMTFKKFQQALSNEKLLYEIMDKGHSESAEKIKHLFKGIWSLEDKDIETDIVKVIEKAIANPHDYVIKPQKEGGGNNIYDEHLKKLLLTSTKEQLNHYLIMERIYPPQVKAYLLKKGQVTECIGNSELGIFSSVFIDTKKQEPLSNFTFSRLLRTKSVEINEGGVLSGFSAIDSPWVIDEAAQQPVTLLESSTAAVEAREQIKPMISYL